MLKTTLVSIVLWVLSGLIFFAYGQEPPDEVATSPSIRAEFQKLLDEIKGRPGYARTEPMRGQPPAVPDAIRLEQLVKESLQNNPEVQAARKRFEAGRTRPSQESAWPEPTLGFMSTNMSNPIPFTTIGRDPQSNAGISISQEFPFPGKLKLKGDIAQKESDSEWQSYRATQLGVAARMKAAYYELSYYHKAIDIIQKNKDLLEQLARIAAARYEVGSGIQQDIIKAQVEVSVLIVKQTALEQKKNSAVAQINSLLNRPPDYPLGRPAPFEKSVLPFTLDNLYQSAARSSPTIHLRKDLIQRNSLAMDLARRQYYPDFMIGGYYGSSGGLPDMWQIKFDVKLPLYFWRKQRYGVEESVHNLVQSRKEYEAALQQVNFNVKDQYLQATASEKLLHLYSGRIIPQAALALESSLSSYEVGKVDFLTLLNNFITVLNYELSYYEELTNFQKALVRMEEVVAVPLIQ